MPTTSSDVKWRVPNVVLLPPDKELLLKLRAKLEEKYQKPITITEAIRIAIRTLANQN